MSQSHAPDGGRYVIPQQVGGPGEFGPPPAPMGPEPVYAPAYAPGAVPDIRPRIALSLGDDLPVAGTGKRLLAFTVDQLIAWTLVVAFGAAISGAVVAYVHSQVTDPVFWQDLLQHSFRSAWPRLVSGHAEAAGQAALDTAVHDVVTKLLVPVLAGVAVIVLAVAFLPVVYQWAGLCWFGTTPGRALTGVKVARPPHPHDLPDKRTRRLPARHALTRSLIGPPLLVLGLLLAVPAATGMAALGATPTGIVVLIAGLALLLLGVWDPIHALLAKDGIPRTLHDRMAGTVVVDLERAATARRMAGSAGTQARELAAGAGAQARERAAGAGAQVRAQATDRLQQARDSQAAQSAAARLHQARHSQAGQAAAARLQQARDSQPGQAAAARLHQARQSETAKRLSARLRRAKDKLSDG
ncbi:RDD family protein [Streptomyces sp. NPDC051940]|uniref:RDD family protein n=1 Tax=Streptomyces sp. NPDC051940 TaxID=3155675 RepID=UPI00341F2F5B